MKHILIFIFFSLSFVLFGQNDTHPNFTQSQLDSALNGTKQVEIPSHFNSNGDKNTWDLDLKDLGDVIKASIGLSTDTDIKLLFSVVNDSIRIDSFDNKSGVIIGSPQFIDDVINKQLVIPSDNSCITTTDEVVIKKSDGSLVSKPNSSFKRNEVYPAGNYIINTTDQIIYAVGGSTITLPTCASNCSEKTIYRDACSDGIITVNVSGGGTIDGVHTSRILPVGRGGYTYECVNGNWRIKSEFFEQDQSCALFSLLNSTNANVTVWTTDGQPYSVDWGDGTSSGLIASGTATSTLYGTAFTGSIKICKTCGVSPIYKVHFNSGNWNFNVNDLTQFPNLEYVDIYTGVTSGDIGNLPSLLTYYENQGQNITSGDIGNLPSGLTYYSNVGQNTTSGNIANLPSGLLTYSNHGQNTTSGEIGNLPSGLITYTNSGQNITSGNIANLPSGLISFTNYGQNTTSGNIANLPSGLIAYVNSGQNTTSGNISNLPSGLTYYENHGQSTTSGNIANLPSGLTYFSNSGQNTTSGDIANLPSGLTYYLNQGQNTTNGDIANLPSGLIFYTNIGQNTTSGDIGNLPSGLTYYLNHGQNITSGDIGNLPSGLTYYANEGQNTVSDYSGGNLNSGITNFISIPSSGGLSASEVDALFIEFASTLPGIGYINITGTNAAPTAASQMARTTLINAGTTVIHN